MSNWITGLFGRRPKRAADRSIPAELRRAPLREFVYLDEVSLRSLLSSQTGEITESTSEQSVDALQTEVSAALGARPGLVAKAELGSKFQTSNSSTLQTARKATVQSWFRDLHGIPGLRLIEPTQVSTPAADVGSLKKISDRSLLLDSRTLRRGALVEFRVRLRADPVFHLGTMVSEFSAMAEEMPEAFATKEAKEALSQAQPINRVLQRLLAGLIPIRAEAIDYSVVEIDGQEYLAHKEAIKGLCLDTRPLEVVGVTEHLAYWKDIRRVLFSGASFTLLGRIARDGVHDSWTPVKLADLFQGVAPDLVNQINAASDEQHVTPQLGTFSALPDTQLGAALRTYTQDLLERAGQTIDSETEELEALISALQVRSSSVSDQRVAFREMRNLIARLVDVNVTAEEDLALRQKAREVSGLSLFPTVNPPSSPAMVTVHSPGKVEREARLLDLEVIAIYW